MIEALLKGVLLGCILAISVGPVIFTVIKQSINNGREGGLSFVAGVWFSDIALIILCNAFSEMVSSLMVYRNTIGYSGSIFLLCIGVFYIFFKKVKARTGVEGSIMKFKRTDFAKICTSGFLINTLNPGVMMFWLTTATAFSITHTFYHRVIIFSTCMALNIGADILKVFLAGKIRNRLTVHNISILNKVSGIILVVFAFALMWGMWYSNQLED